MSKPLPIHLILLPGLDGTGELFAPLLRRIERMHIHADEPQLIAHALRYPTHDKLDLRQLHHAVEHYIAHNLPEDARYVILGESFSGPVAITVAYAAQTAAAKPHAAVWLFTAFAVFAAFAHDPTPLAWR